MTSSIEKNGIVVLPLQENVLAWVAKVSLEMHGLPMLKNT